MMDEYEIKDWIGEIDRELKGTMSGWTVDRLVGDRRVLNQVLNGKREISAGKIHSDEEVQAQSDEKVSSSVLTIEFNAILSGRCIIVCAFEEEYAACKLNDGSIKFFKVIGNRKHFEEICNR